MLNKITSLFALCLILLPSVSLAEIARDTRQISYEVGCGGVEENVVAEDSSSSAGNATRDEYADCGDLSSPLLTLSASKAWTLYPVRESLEPRFKFPVFSKGTFF